MDSDPIEDGPFYSFYFATGLLILILLYLPS